MKFVIGLVADIYSNKITYKKGKYDDPSSNLKFDIKHLYNQTIKLY